MLDGPDLVRIRLDTPVGNQETEELPRRDAKHALLRVEHHARSAEATERLVQVVDQGRPVPGLDDQVVHVCLHVPA